MKTLLDFLQSASNAVAGNVSGPVDLLGMGLNKIGVPVGNKPIGGSEWMKEKGLLRDVQPGAARVLGETAGLLGPAMVTQFAPQIAKGLLQGADNLAAPRTLNPQAGMALFDTAGLPNKGRELIQAKAQSLADDLQKHGFSVDLQHSGSAAGPSSYLRLSDPQTGRFFPQQVRLSGHSKGPSESLGVINVNEDEFGDVLASAMAMRGQGRSTAMQMEDYAKNLIESGEKPKAAYRMARERFTTP